MNALEREEFLSTLHYYTFEKDSPSGFTSFSEQKLEEVDPTLAMLYKQMVSYEEAFCSRLRDITND